MKVLFCLALFEQISADHTSNFFRKILASHDEKYHKNPQDSGFEEYLAKDLMPKNLPKSQKRLKFSDRRRSFIENLKNRVIKTELEAMVDNLSGGPGFHAKRHTFDEFHETRSFDTYTVFKEYYNEYDVMKKLLLEEKKKKTKSKNFRLKSFRRYHRTS